jgi:hypothetical protein
MYTFVLLQRESYFIIICQELLAAFACEMENKKNKLYTVLHTFIQECKPKAISYIL